MKVFSLARYAFGIAAGVALLAGCSANGTTPSLGGSSVAPQSVIGGHHSIQDLSKMWAMTNVMHKGLPLVQHPLTHSWMKKPPPGTSGTLWATDIEYATVDLIAYPSGTLTGQVSGFSYPYGDCTDSSGNVYVADFSQEKGFEIQAGTTNIINSWNTGGEAIGCSVSNSGDVSFTNFYPGGVVVFPGGGATGTTYSGPAYDWPAGYDSNGNLFVECNYASPCSTPKLAELVSGSWQILNFNKSIGFGDAVQRYGKKALGVGDQSYNGQFENAIYLTKVSGSTATASKSLPFTGSGCSTYQDDSSSWGEIGKKPDGLGPKKVKDVAMDDDDCFGSPINIYKGKGGAPISQLLPIHYEYDEGVTFTSP